MHKRHSQSDNSESRFNRWIRLGGGGAVEPCLKLFVFLYTRVGQDFTLCSRLRHSISGLYGQPVVRNRKAASRANRKRREEPLQFLGEKKVA